jgi:hypothetical protein
MNEEFTAKKAPVEELTIPTTDLNPSPVAAQTEDWGMTNPLVKPLDGMKNGDGWKMPEPVFRVSDGFCPLDINDNGKTKADGNPPKSSAAPPKQSPTDESLANLYAPPDKEEDVDLSQHTMHNLSLSDLNVEIPELATAVPNSAAAPQPNISEEFIVKPVANEAPTEKKQRSETMRLFFAALGVLAMLSFAAGFLALVYYLFFYKAAE